MVFGLVSFDNGGVQASLRASRLNHLPATSCHRYRLTLSPNPPRFRQMGKPFAFLPLLGFESRFVKKFERVLPNYSHFLFVKLFVDQKRRKKAFFLSQMFNPNDT